MITLGLIFYLIILIFNIYDAYYDYQDFSKTMDCYPKLNNFKTNNYETQIKLKVLAQENTKISKILKIKDPEFLINPYDEGMSFDASGSGFLKSRVIFDLNLIENLDEGGLVSILAHELYHIKERHLLKSLFLKLTTNLIIFLGLYLFVIKNYPSLENVSYYFAIPLFFAILLTHIFVSYQVDSFSNVLSQLREYQCDIFAVKVNGFENLKKIAIVLEKDRQFEWFKTPKTFKEKIKFMLSVSHPTWEMRLEKCKKVKN